MKQLVYDCFKDRVGNGRVGVGDNACESGWMTGWVGRVGGSYLHGPRIVAQAQPAFSK